MSASPISLVAGYRTTDFDFGDADTWTIGVNFVLGTGLHSYGFGSGGYWYVGGFVAFELLVITAARDAAASQGSCAVASAAEQHSLAQAIASIGLLAGFGRRAALACISHRFDHFTDRLRTPDRGSSRPWRR